MLKSKLSIEVESLARTTRREGSYESSESSKSVEIRQFR
jgi:hypothetical protein